MNAHSLRDESEMAVGPFAEAKIDRVVSIATENSSKSDCSIISTRLQAALEVPGEENVRVARSTTRGQ
jgi:hypothetical protein